MTANQLKFKVMLFLGMIVLWSGTVFGESSSRITQANQLYNQSQFQEAAELYEQALTEGKTNGHLYFNLGNAYFRTGNLARAVLNYAKAQNLLPRDEDVEANLEYAVRQTEDQLDGRKAHLLESVLFWTRDFNLKEHTRALLWLNLAFWVTMAVWLHIKTQASRSARNILLGLLILALMSTGFRGYLESRQNFGVVLPKTIDVHSGWNTDTATLFQLHQGALVSVSQEKEQWSEIELPDGKKGWTQNSSLAR
jgi:tetratricopeptide (TPR) repeat protein